MDSEPSSAGGGELTAAGVDPFDEIVYRALLGRSSASPSEVGELLGRPTEHVARALNRLRDHGLVGRMSGTRLRYASAEPEAAISALVRERSLELERVRGAAQGLAELFSSTHAAESDEVEIIPNRKALGMFVRVQQEAQEELIALDRPPYAMTSSNPVEKSAMTRGVQYRVVYAPESLTWPGVYDDIKELVDHGEEARVLPGMRAKLAIADRRLAVMPLSLDIANAHAAVIRPSILLDALVDYWDLCWRVALPLDVMSAGRPPPGDPAMTRVDGLQGAEGSPDPIMAITDEDRSLLTLLVSGLKDEAIARQLGWSVRTMRRRMSRLHDLLGATNRFQAGAIAHRRGWI